MTERYKAAGRFSRKEYLEEQGEPYEFGADLAVDTFNRSENS